MKNKKQYSSFTILDIFILLPFGICPREFSFVGVQLPGLVPKN